MSLSSSFTNSRVRSIGIAGLAVLAGAGLMGTGSAHAATMPASAPLSQQTANTFVPAGLSAPVQSLGGGSQDTGSGGSQDTGSDDPFPGDPGIYRAQPILPPRQL
jgi:hypothetical protein